MRSAPSHLRKPHLGACCQASHVLAKHQHSTRATQPHAYSHAHAHSCIAPLLMSPTCAHGVRLQSTRGSDDTLAPAVPALARSPAFSSACVRQMQGGSARAPVRAGGTHGGRARGGASVWVAQAGARRHMGAMHACQGCRPQGCCCCCRAGPL